MYKHTYKQILKKLQKKEEFLNNLHKTDTPIFQKPHFIFSADNPIYPDQQKLKMNHEKVMELLKDKGYNPIEIKGKYGDEERSILIPNIDSKKTKHLFKLARDLGQENSIYSSGYDHEMHFHHGSNQGQYVKGQGTTIHKQTPKDYYSTLPSGEIFTHNFNFDQYYPRETSTLGKPKEDKLNKSEGEYRFYLAKNEEDDHPLTRTNPDLKLIHYSPKQGLGKIDPKYHGERRIGSEAKYGTPENKMSFYYLEGTKPEDIVMSGAKSKYVAKLGDKKVYDIGKDPMGFYKQLKEKSMNRQVNPGSVSIDEYHKAIKDAGYHGVYNSSLNDTMKNVVGMFGHADIEAEYPIHRKDRERASGYNYNEPEQHRADDYEYAKEQGHSNPSFFSKLRTTFSRKKK